jgi:hypothetical protein
MRGVSSVFLTLGVVLLLAGCGGGVDVNSDYDPNFNFSTLKTFSIVKFNVSSSTGNSGNMLLIQRIVDATKAELVYKGYTEVDEDSADFLVVMHAGNQQQLQVDPGWGYGYWGGYGYGGWGGYGGGGSAYTYETGTLAYDMVNRENKQAIWHGVGEALASNSRSQEEVNAGVKKILRDFPPGGGGSGQQ